jgi:hypothetical protein
VYEKYIDIFDGFDGSTVSYITLDSTALPSFCMSPSVSIVKYNRIKEKDWQEYVYIEWLY